MKATVNVGNGVSIDVSGDTQIELFKSIAKVQATFSFNKCGRCGSENVQFQVRTTDNDEDYPEMVCRDVNCRAKLPFGIAKKTFDLYPKRKWDTLSPKQKIERASEEEYAQSHYGYLPNEGWYKYERPGEASKRMAKPTSTTKSKMPPKTEVIVEEEEEEYDEIPF